jgi:hypothetical protein
MIDWDYERSRCWFPGSSEAAPAPAEERETPVEGCINCGESNDGGYMSGFEGDADEGAVGPFCSQCWEFLRETFSPRPAEDRAVTAPQEPEQEKLHEASVSATNVEGPAQQGRHADSTNNRMASESTSEGEARATDAGNRDRQSWQEVERRLAALTHAIEALRGQLGKWLKEHIAVSDPADYRCDCDLCVETRAAILKEWEGRHA